MNTVTPTALFARRFLADYARNPVNLLFIVLVPVVFVVVAAGSLAETAKFSAGPPPAGPCRPPPPAGRPGSCP